jgi:RHH-type rel operon transcriptional repressor/antitoxin RelB
MDAITSKEAGTRTINVRVPAKVYEQLESLAKSTDRSKSFVTIQALSTYLDEQSWQIAEIKAAIGEADKDDFATDEQVSSVFAKYGA